MRNKLILAFPFFLFLLLLPINAYAIGIGPSRTVIDYQPGYSGLFDYFVLNQDSTTLETSIYVSGDLAQYITIDKDRFTVAPGDRGFFTVTVDFPAGLDISPGRHDNRVGAKQLMPAGIGTLAAVATVESQFWIEVPYPGKYVDIQFDATDAPLGGYSELNLTATNKGKEDIDNIDVNINIYNTETDDLVGSVDLGSQSMKVNDVASFTGSWKGNDVGTYRAVATVAYDGSSKTVEKEFRIGELVVSINSITGNAIHPDSIGKIEVGIESGWNERIENVYCDVNVNGGNIRTESISLQPWGNATLNAFWDTAGVEPGKYLVKATAYYSSKTAVKTGTVEVTNAGLALDNNIIFIAIIIMIMVFFLSSRKRKR